MEPAERSTRGTSITLHLKQDQKEFLGEWRLRELITQYSDYVNHPIHLEVKKTTGEGEAQKTETKREVVNKASALWQRRASEVDAAASSGRSGNGAAPGLDLRPPD